MTEFGLAHWIAQSFKLDLTDMQSTRTNYLSDHAKMELKNILQDHVIGRLNSNKPEAVMYHTLLK